MTDPVQAIIDAALKPDFGLQNPFLELASLTLELRKAGYAYDRLQTTWERMKDERRLRRGIFLRKPNDTSISTSKDEALGIMVLSHLFDNGETIKEILDEGLVFGLWLTGRNEKGYWIDSEWFTFWQPHYRGLAKLAASRKITRLEDFSIRLNILVGRVWNMKRVKILFLEGLGYDRDFLASASKSLGDKYRGRYGKNQLYWNILGA